MKNDKQLIWGAAIVLIIIPYFSYLLNLIIAYSNNQLNTIIDGYNRIFSIPTNFFSKSPADIYYFFFLIITTLFPLLIMPVLSLIGVFRFKNNGKSRLLYILLCFVFISTAIRFIPNKIWSIKDFIKNIDSENINYLYLFTNIYFFFHAIVILVISYLCCKYLSQKIILLTDKFEDIYQVNYSSKKERVFTYLIDFSFSISIALSIFSLTILLMRKANEKFILTNFYVSIGYLAFFLSILLYYILSEGLFQTTLGKIITKSTIIDAEGNKIGFKKAISRTLCRLIPFEPFSFLLKERGWHDSITDTYVVKTE